MAKKTAAPAAADSLVGDRTPAPPKKKPSFLSILKSVHQATKLYLALLGLIAGVPGVFLLLAKQWQVSLWFAVPFSAMPAAMILLWLVPTWLEQQNKHRMEVLGIYGQVKDPEYFRLTPYDSASDFRRADNMHEKVYKWLLGNSAPLLYLSGASGSGKSSIISGWILPKLAREGVPTHVVTARVIGDPVTAITRALLKPRAIWERPPSSGNESLRELMERATKKVKPRKLLLILDQFEEFLVLADVEQRDAFAALLHSLAEVPLRDLQMLMILRNDYLALLHALSLPEFTADRMEIPPFLERDAMAFLRNSGLKISAELENEIREEAREVEQTPGLMRPITINLFGLVLRHFEVLPKNYRRGTRLRSYLRGLIQRNELREFAPLVLRSMMTGNGTKKPVSGAEIAGKLGINPNHVRGCLVQLANEGVVRELDRDQGKWEIAHDFIAALYHQILAGWHRSAWRRARPWAIGGGLGLWLVAMATLPMIVGMWQERQDQQNLIELGFSRVDCDERNRTAFGPGCLAWTITNHFKAASLPVATPFLQGLKNTRALLLAQSGVQDIDALKGLSNLTTLELQYNSGVEKVDALKGLTNLQALNLLETSVKNIDALSHLTNLQRLNLSETFVQNLDALNHLSALQTLDLNNTPKLENVDGLKGGVPSLREINLGRSSVENIDGLRGLASLRELDLGATPVVNIDALKGLTGLRELDLSETKVDNIGALKGSTGLQKLNLNRTKVDNIDALKGLRNLQELYLSFTSVKNIDALKGLTGLKILNLASTNVDDINALEGLTSLVDLDLSGTKVDNINALKGLHGLTTLNLVRTEVENIDALKGLTGLRDLALPDSPIKYLETLKAMTNLRRIRSPAFPLQDDATLKAALPGIQFDVD